MYYVYLIKNELNEIYYGSTNDLKRRIFEHNNGKSFSTKIIAGNSYFAKPIFRKKMLEKEREDLNIMDKLWLN